MAADPRDDPNKRDLYDDQVPPHAPGDDRQPRELEADVPETTDDESTVEPAAEVEPTEPTVEPAGDAPAADAPHD